MEACITSSWVRDPRPARAVLASARSGLVDLADLAGAFDVAFAADFVADLRFPAIGPPSFDP